MPWPRAAAGGGGVRQAVRRWGGAAWRLYGRTVFGPTMTSSVPSSPCHCGSVGFARWRSIAGRIGLSTAPSSRLARVAERCFIGVRSGRCSVRWRPWKRYGWHRGHLGPTSTPPTGRRRQRRCGRTSRKGHWRGFRALRNPVGLRASTRSRDAHSRLARVARSPAATRGWCRRPLGHPSREEHCGTSAALSGASARRLARRASRSARWHAAREGGASGLAA